MKNIQLTKLRLLNFKGIQSFETDFIQQTNIEGANASGKTTLMDAFMWLLFGKDSEGRADFELKTLDENNKPIHRLSHEVEVKLIVGNSVMTLKKVYSEKWTRRRGNDEEEMTGHTTDCFIDDVAMSITEYGMKINEVCPESQFRLITNPLSFPSLHWQVQRDLLFKMAGTIDPKLICVGKNDLLDLLERMGTYKTEDYKKIVAARRLKCKEALDQVKPKIEENKRMTPQIMDWSGIEKDIKDKKTSLKEIEEQINSEISRVEVKQVEVQSYRNEVRELQNKLAEIEADQKKDNLKEFYTSLEEYNAKRVELNSALSKAKELQAEKISHSKAIEEIEGKITLSKQAWFAIKSEALVFSDKDFSCPTCKRMFEVDDVAEKQAEMMASFNLSKANRLEENVKAGKALQAQKIELQEKIEKIDLELPKLETIISVVSGLAKDVEPSQPLFIFTQTPQVLEINLKIGNLIDLINSPISLPDTKELQEKKDSLIIEIEGLNKSLSLRDEVERHSKRLNELLGEEKALAGELAKEEKEEQLVKDYSSLLMSAVEERISDLFKIVKFKIFDQKINGNIDETCVPMVNGVPFSSLNNAMKISAGIDIINAISKHLGITAPIWLDNRESVTSIPETDSQIINLFVVNNSPLTVK